MREGRDEKLARAAEFRGYAANSVSRDEQNRADCAEIAKRHEDEAAVYEKALASLSS